MKLRQHAPTGKSFRFVRAGGRAGGRAVLDIMSVPAEKVFPPRLSLFPFGAPGGFPFSLERYMNVCIMNVL